MEENIVGSRTALASLLFIASFYLIYDLPNERVDNVDEGNIELMNTQDYYDCSLMRYKMTE